MAVSPERPSVLAIVQARISSTRLPGKVLKPILDQPMLIQQINRVRQCKTLNHIVIATSILEEDDAICELCTETGIDFFRGELVDVLDRYYRAAKAFSPEHIVRLTGDCPLIDPYLIDALVTYYLDGDYDYASNCLNPTYPDGLDAEIFSFRTLKTAWERAVKPSEREHVTLFMHTHPETFKLGELRSRKDLSSLRWTVDNQEDLDFVRKVYEFLYDENPFFNMDDILNLLALKPEITKINSHIHRNEGLEISFQKESHENQ